MKITICLVLIFLMPLTFHAGAKSFLGAPVMPSGETRLETEDRLEMTHSLSHDDILAFYQEALEAYKDIKFRDREDVTRIEDNGNLAWHSITISKRDKAGTKVTIVKDNWTWIIGTLMLRYVGVFVVLLFLYLGMAFSGAIISRIVRKGDEAREDS